MLHQSLYLLIFLGYILQIPSHYILNGVAETSHLWTNCDTTRKGPGTDKDAGAVGDASIGTEWPES